jgi:hypothetical protein
LRTKKTQNPQLVFCLTKGKGVFSLKLFRSGRRARRPEDWSSELPRQGHHTSLLSRLPIPRPVSDNYQNRFPSTYSPNLFRRDATRGCQASVDSNPLYGEGSYNQSSFGSESMPYRPLDHRDEPPQKRQRRNLSFPDVDTRYVLGSHQGPSHGSGEDPTTPHSASPSFGDSYFSQYATQNRSNDSPSSRTYMAQPGRQYPYTDFNQYPTPDSSRSYQGHISNRLSMGSELTIGYGGSTEPGRHHYPSSAETQVSVAAPAAMHPPVQGAGRPSAASDSKYWPGSFENSTTSGAYHGRNSSGSALPTGHLLPAPMNLQSRLSADNTMHSM